MSEVLRNANYAYSRSILDQIFSELKECARGYGYMLAVHGSLKKDIDLIAVPWIENAEDQDYLARKLIAKIKEYFGEACQAGDVGIKPHGRKAYTIVAKGSNVYFDLSIMPMKDCCQ